MQSNDKFAYLQIRDLEREISFIKSYSLKELYRKYGSFSKITFNNKDLLKFLIIDGWIAEDYNDYLTYYYEGVLSRTDIEFIKAFITGVTKDYDYGINNPQLCYSTIMARLRNKTY